MSYFCGSASSNALTPCQIVGTPADTVTFSLTIKSRNVFGVMNRWGITCLQPSIEAAKGSPHPIAWNMGTIPNSESIAVSPMESVSDSVSVWR